MQSTLEQTPRRIPLWPITCARSIKIKNNGRVSAEVLSDVAKIGFAPGYLFRPVRRHAIGECRLH
jgi:hypothetical protein